MNSRLRAAQRRFPGGRRRKPEGPGVSVLLARAQGWRAHRGAMARRCHRPTWAHATTAPSPPAVSGPRLGYRAHRRLRPGSRSRTTQCGPPGSRRRQALRQRAERRFDSARSARRPKTVSGEWRDRRQRRWSRRIPVPDARARPFPHVNVRVGACVERNRFAVAVAVPAACG